MTLFLPLPPLLFLAEILEATVLVAFNIIQPMLWKAAQNNSRKYGEKEFYLFPIIFTSVAIFFDFLVLTALGLIVWVA